MCQYPGIVGRQEGDGPGEGGEDRGAKVHWSVTVSEGPRWTCVINLSRNLGGVRREENKLLYKKRSESRVRRGNRNVLCSLIGSNSHSCSDWFHIELNVPNTDGLTNDRAIVSE